MHDLADTKAAKSHLRIIDHEEFAFPRQQLHEAERRDADTHTFANEFNATVRLSHTGLLGRSRGC
jgi:hypothetical protein